MLSASAVIGGAVGIYRDKIKNLFKKVFKGDESLIFVSLKNNPKVLALDDCKSLNKDLKKMLEHQIKLANRIITKNRKTKNSLIRKQIGWAYMCFKYAIRQFKRFKKIIIA